MTATKQAQWDTLAGHLIGYQASISRTWRGARLPGIVALLSDRLNLRPARSYLDFVT